MQKPAYLKGFPLSHLWPLTYALPCPLHLYLFPFRNLSDMILWVDSLISEEISGPETKMQNSRRLRLLFPATGAGTENIVGFTFQVQLKAGTRGN